MLALALALGIVAVLGALVSSLSYMRRPRISVDLVARCFSEMPEWRKDQNRLVSQNGLVLWLYRRSDSFFAERYCEVLCAGYRGKLTYAWKRTHIGTGISYPVEYSWSIKSVFRNEEREQGVKLILCRFLNRRGFFRTDDGTPWFDEDGRLIRETS